MAGWFADDSFWADVFAFEFPETAWTAADTEVEGVIQLSGFQQGAALDLGCGPGRHAVALARRGFRVTAVDLSAFHLAKARERALAAQVSVEFAQADMRSFVRPQTFDLVICLFTSFGYFDAKEDDLGVLRNIHRSLTPNGALVMDLLGKERLGPGRSSRPSRRRPPMAPCSSGGTRSSTTGPGSGTNGSSSATVGRGPSASPCGSFQARS